MTTFLKSILGLTLIFLIDTSGLAQQDPQFTQYYFNPLSTNSAYAGTRDALSMNLVAREQWLGIDGRPRTQALSIHAPLKDTKLAWGLGFTSDQHGPVKSSYLSGDGAYSFRITETSELSLGLKASLHFFRAELSALETNNDISFSKDLSSQAIPNFGFSAYWYSKTHFIGLSAPRLIENGVISEVGTIEVPSEKRHLFLTAGKVFTLNHSLKFKPTLFMKYVGGAPLSTDISANLLIQERLWVGLFARLKDSAGLMVSYQVNDNIRIGYSYDKTISNLAGFNSGSHEILINYDLKLGKEKTLSPRYF